MKCDRPVRRALQKLLDICVSGVAQCLGRAGGLELSLAHQIDLVSDFK